MLERRTFLTCALATGVAASLPGLAFGKGMVPFKLFDTHAHFYTDDVAHYPFNAKGARYGAEKMIAKATAHPMKPEVIFKLWDEAGVEGGCGVQYNSTYFTDNSYLLDIATKYPKRIVPVVILAPTDPATPAMLAKLAKENHISGVRFTGVPDKDGNYNFLSEAAQATWAACNQLGLVIVLMPIGGNMPPTMKVVGDHAARYPNVDIVLDHVGFPKPDAFPSTFGLSPEHVALAQRKNVYYKYTTLLMDQLAEAKVPAKDFLSYAVGVYGANHFVWGSDVGNSEGNYPDFVKNALDSAAGLTLAQKKDMFHDTARRVFIPGGRGPARA
jgi:predicted TIM-barrel fold metal-dependent hydrolase